MYIVILVFVVIALIIKVNIDMCKSADADAKIAKDRRERIYMNNRFTNYDKEHELKKKIDDSTFVSNKETIPFQKEIISDVIDDLKYIYGNNYYIAYKKFFHPVAFSDKDYKNAAKEKDGYLLEFYNNIPNNAPYEDRKNSIAFKKGRLYLPDIRDAYSGREIILDLLLSHDGLIYHKQAEPFLSYSCLSSPDDSKYKMIYFYRFTQRLEYNLKKYYAEHGYRLDWINKYLNLYYHNMGRNHDFVWSMNRKYQQDYERAWEDDGTPTLLLEYIDSLPEYYKIPDNLKTGIKYDFKVSEGD